MKHLFSSLRWRLTVWYVCLLAGALVVFSAGVYAVMRHQLIDTEDESLQSLALLIDHSVVLENTTLRLDDERQTTKHGERFVRLYSENRSLGYDSSATVGSVPDLAQSYTSARKGTQEFETVQINNDLFRVLAVPVRRNGQIVGVLQVAEELEYRALDRLAIVLVAGVPLTLLVASWGGAFLAGRALAPIDRLTHAAQQITSRDLGQRIGLPPRNDELGRLAATFDTMIDRLDHAFRRQRRFTADASHELRTPLTAIRGQIEVVLSRERSVEDYRAVLGSVLAQTERMSRLVNDLLTLARADTDTLPLHHEALDLSQIVRDVATQLQPLAAERHICLRAHAPQPAAIFGDEDRLLQVLFNLLDNAFGHTPSGGEVELCCWTEADQALVTVRDSGVGIAEEHLPHIFDRFYRIDTSRSRERGGAGLGLAIVRAQVEAHGGTVEVQSQSGHGATFVMRLPRSTNPQV